MDSHSNSMHSTNEKRSYSIWHQTEMAENNRYKRSVEDSITIIGHAKLEENELKSVTQVLSFREEGKMVHDYKFMELDSKLLNKLYEGQSLTFRGNKDEMAVICTEDTTYDVKEAETSNSMLLLSDLKLSDEIGVEHVERVLEEREVVGIYFKYFELRECVPRLQKLLQILEPSQYRGKEFEADLLSAQKVKMYTLDDLLQVVQASQLELEVALKEFLICKIGDNYRSLEHDYLFQVLSYILKVVEENSWPLNEVVKTETLTSLSGIVNVAILDQVFDWFTESTGSLDRNGQKLYALKVDRVCRCLGEALLRPVDKFNLQDFLMAWQQSVPEGMQTHTKYLDGIALMDRKCKPEVIWYFPETKLPEDIYERIRTLFKVREKWTLDEITPFVRRLATKQTTVAAMLTKHARGSTVGGVRYYSAKHGK